MKHSVTFVILVIFASMFAGCTGGTVEDKTQTSEDSLDQSNEMTDLEKYGIHENSTFFTWNRCSPLIDTTLLEGQSFYDAFDDSNLDLSICDSQDQRCEIESQTPLSLPREFTIDFASSGASDTELLRPKQNFGRYVLIYNYWLDGNNYISNCDQENCSLPL